MIEQPEVWFGYREGRNVTSHAYDEKKAKQVYAGARSFLPDARKLVVELKRRG